MWIKSFRLTGYSAFSDTGLVELGPSYNLFIGQNNVGKSALLRSLVPRLQDLRHKSDAEWRHNFLPVPRLEFEVSTTGAEMAERIIATGRTISVPLTDPSEASKASVLALPTLGPMIVKFERNVEQPTQIVSPWPWL